MKISPPSVPAGLMQAAHAVDVKLGKIANTVQTHIKNMVATHPLLSAVNGLAMMLLSVAAPIAAGPIGFIALPLLPAGWHVFTESAKQLVQNAKATRAANKQAQLDKLTPYFTIDSDTLQK